MLKAYKGTWLHYIDKEHGIDLGCLTRCDHPKTAL